MQKVPGERYVYKFLPDTMQAANPFTNQLALGYGQDPSKLFSKIDILYIISNQFWSFSNCDFSALGCFRRTESELATDSSASWCSITVVQ